MKVQNFDPREAVSGNVTTKVRRNKSIGSIGKIRKQYYIRLSYQGLFQKVSEEYSTQENNGYHCLPQIFVALGVSIRTTESGTVL